MLLPDGAQKYLSKIFDDKWMRENGFLDEADPLGTVARAAASQEAARALITAQKGDSVRDVIATMRDTGVSQMPVLDADGGRLAGLVSRGRSARLLGARARAGSTSPIEPLGRSRTTRRSRPRTRIHLLRNIFNDAQMVVRRDRRRHRRRHHQDRPHRVPGRAQTERRARRAFDSRTPNAGRAGIETLADPRRPAPGADRPARS